MIDTQFMLSVNKFLNTEFEATKEQTDLIAEIMLLASNCLTGQEHKLLVAVEEFECLEDYEQRLSLRERLLTFLEAKIHKYEIKPRDMFIALLTASSILSKKLGDSSFNNELILKPITHNYDEEFTTDFDEFMSNELSQNLVDLASKANECRVSQRYDEALPLAEKFLGVWREHIELWKKTYRDFSGYLYQGDFDVWSAWMMRMYVILQQKGGLDNLVEYANFLNELPEECLLIDTESFDANYRRFTQAYDILPRMIEVIKSEPGITQRDVYRKLAIAGQVNQWMFEYADKLGLIERIRDGKSLRLHIASA